MMSDYKLLTLRQTAELLRIDERDIGQLLRDGDLPGYKLGQRWRISLEDLNSFFRKHGNVTRDQLRSGKAASKPNGAQLELDPPRPHKDHRSIEATKTNDGTREIHSDNAHYETDSNWVPPWRGDE